MRKLSNNKAELKKSVAYKKNRVNHENDVNGVVLVFLLLTLNIFHTFFSVFVVDFEQVNVSWDRLLPKVLLLINKNSIPVTKYKLYG